MQVDKDWAVWYTQFMNKESAIREGLAQGKTLHTIGQALGVSKQRIYQLMERYEINSPRPRQHGYWRKQSPKHRWLHRTMVSKGYPKALFDHLAPQLPDVCPALGIPLDYVNGSNQHRENSPSIDRIDSTVGYVIGNVQILSFRANRIKSDSTPEELMKLAQFMLNPR